MADYFIKQWTKATTSVGSTKDEAIEISVNNRAATRQAIIDQLRSKGLRVRTRSAWKAEDIAKGVVKDWNYSGIAIHHAGNSFSCSADGVEQMRKAEAIDLGHFGQVSYHYAVDCAGVVYEALDIRYRGANIEGNNTGVIGIVLLADLSLPGEAIEHGPGAWATTQKKGLWHGFKELMGEASDAVDFGYDVPSDKQVESTSLLCHALADFFGISKLGGHGEWAALKGNKRACPGAYGLVVARVLRNELKVSAP
ncbi:peptidoglycan recognition family protein [Dyella sp. C11]|uniref:peptidoglycan recognition protein family protein n=1 Tax=Dyella sp. C11 TaxID=2126991 RepID=UPI000D6432EF|nr:peptidoglycan recognition family protein [Dyella sp. C11]